MLGLDSSCNAKCIKIQPTITTKQGTKEFRFVLIPTRTKTTTEHFLSLIFIGNKGQVLCHHTIPGIFTAGHKYESGKKMREFYAKTDSVLEYHPSMNRFLIEQR